MFVAALFYLQTMTFITGLIVYFEKYLLSLLFVMVFIFCGTSISSQEIQWMTMEEALQMRKTENKKILVDMHTDWCGWCKKMEEATFRQPHIAQYINENFLPVKFNAESQEAIDFNSSTYNWVRQGNRGYHELALKFAESLGRLSFPTIVFINENLQIIQPIPGFQKAEKFEPILHYIAGDYYLNTPWKAFEREFEGFNSVSR